MLLASKTHTALLSKDPLRFFLVLLLCPRHSTSRRTYDPPYSGAMFPWESAATGLETCPEWAPTGQLEHHITPDVAWALRLYYLVP